MTFPQTFDSSLYPELLSTTPLVVSLNPIPRHYPSHRHEVMEFSLVVSGNGTERINGLTHHMAPGTLTVIKPFQFHDITNTGEAPLLLLNCMFGLELLTANASAQERELVQSLLSSDATEPVVLQLAQSDHEEMGTLLRQLLLEYRGSGPYRHTLLKAKLLEILIRLERLRGLQATKKTAGSGSPHGLTNRLLVHLHQHYKDELTLSALCDHFHLSKAQLCAILREQTGKTFVELVHEIRLRHACSLLLSSDLGMTDIALEAGFLSSKTFFRVFKRLKRMTPNEYRQAHLSQ